MTTATATFKVVTFNVNGGYNSPGGTWAHRLPLVAALLVDVNADLYLLQEAHEERDEHKKIVAAINAKVGWNRYTLIKGDGGNHFIIRASQFKAINPARNVALPYSRSYSELNLWHKPTGVRSWTWNTHFIASDPSKGRSVEQAKAMREKQAAVVAGRVARLHRVVGGGDANADKDGLRPALASVGHLDVRELSSAENWQFDSRDDYGPNKMRGLWIDHLFAGDLADIDACGLVDSGDASDHNLIWASVSISGTVTQF